MNIEEIISLTGDKIYRRGKSYYRNGYVRFSGLQSLYGLNAYFFEVEGSRRNPYSVVINEKDEIYECNCPYPYTCKHIVAALLYMNNNILKDSDGVALRDNKSSGFLKLKELKEETHLKPSRKVILPDKKDVSDGKYNHYFDYDEVSNNKKNRFKLIFIVQKDSYYHSNDFIIKPALRYIKKDKTFGRVEKFNKEKITEELSSADKVLVKGIRSNSYNEGDLLNRYITYIMNNNNDIYLYREDKKEIKRINFIEIGKILIKFNISAVRDDTLFFDPEIFFLNSDGDIISSIDDSNSMEVTLGNILMFDKAGNIFYKFNDSRMFEFFSRLQFSSGRLEIDDINIIREFVEKEFSDIAKVDFKIKSFEMNYLIPEIIFDVDRSSFNDSLYVNLVYNYDGREFSRDKDEKEEYKGFFFIQSENNEEIKIAVRNYKYERYISVILKDIFRENRSWANQNYGGFYTSRSFFDFEFNQSLEEFIAEYGKDLIENDIEIRLKKNGVNVKISTGKMASRIETGIDWFEVSTTFVDENGEEEEIELDPGLLSSGVIKTGKSYIIISKEEIKKIQKLQSLGMTDNGSLKIQNLNFPAIDEIRNIVKEDENSANYLNEKREIYKKLQNIEKIEDYNLPEKFNGTLRNYQVGGYNWLNFMREHKLNCLLADDMGLGKTIQTLALLQAVKEKGKLGASLLVVPVSTIPNWEDEIDRFTESLTFIRHIGTKRIKEYDYIIQFDLIITSYHTLRNDIEFFKDIDFDYLILDESQNIKNAVSKAHKAVSKIKSDHRLSLTGTPVENNTTELWAQMNFLNPGLLGTRKEFNANYAKPIEKEGSKEVAERLRKIVFPFLLRRKKEDVAKDLPVKEEITVYTEMKSDQRVLYEKYRRFYSGKINEAINLKGLQKSSMEIFEGLLRLRQIALFPELADKEYEKIDSCKFDLLKDMVDEIIEEGHKILIFSQFVKSLKIIQDYIIEKGYKYSYIDGSVKNRKKEIDDFQKNDDVKVFLLSIKAGGVGINLTAADYVILFDPWWNPAVESQAVDRSHRIGQEKKVFAYRLIVKDTIEEKIQILQNRKKELVDKLITEEAGFFKSLSGNDVLELFE